MHLYRTTTVRNCSPGNFYGVLHDLKWENKTYKLERSVTDVFI